jgi:proline racemase
VVAPGRLDRSATGTATSARLAVLAARGLIGDGDDFVNESVIGTHFVGRIVGRTEVGGVEAIVPAISGRAWITGTHQFVLDPDDPFPEGFRLSDTWGAGL